MKIEYARLPVVFSSIPASTAYVASIAAIVMLVMERSLGGILPASGCGPQCEVEQLSGARLLQEQVWRPRDETGSVAGERAGRESGEPDEHERILGTQWAQPPTFAHMGAP